MEDKKTIDGETVPLTPEQQAELDEAVAAEKAAAEAPAKYRALMEHLTKVPQMIYGLLGRDSSGAAAYCRNKAIEKLEECIHRLGDGMAAIKYREQMQMDAAQQAQDTGKVIQVSDWAGKKGS